MRAILATLVEIERDDGRTVMTGKLGDCSVVLERVATSKRGNAVWQLSLAAGGRLDRAKSNSRIGWRQRQRRAEGVESIGGND